MTTQEFGERLKSWREDAGINTAELAAKVTLLLPDALITKYDIEKYEAGDHFPSFLKGIYIARALDLTVEQLCEDRKAKV